MNPNAWNTGTSRPVPPASRWGVRAETFETVVSQMVRNRSSRYSKFPLPPFETGVAAIRNRCPGHSKPGTFPFEAGRRSHSKPGTRSHSKTGPTGFETAGLGCVGPAAVRCPGVHTKVSHLGFKWPRSCTAPQLHGPAGLGCVGPAAVRLPGVLLSFQTNF